MSGDGAIMSFIVLFKHLTLSRKINTLIMIMIKPYLMISRKLA